MATLLVKSAMAHGKQRHTHGLLPQSGPPSSHVAQTDGAEERPRA